MNLFIETVSLNHHNVMPRKASRAIKSYVERLNNTILIINR